MSIKILIIEDEQIIRSLLARMIVKKFPSCIVIEAENGAKGLKAVEAENPDVVFLDVNMPMMNGLETLSLIRKIPRFKNLPVFIMTSVSERDIVVKFMNLGIRGYILKPPEKSVVYAQLDKIADELRLADKSAASGKKSVLLIDTDADKTFSKTFVDVFAPFAEIRIADTLRDALRLFIEQTPTDICIAESNIQNNKELDERIIIRKLKNAAPSQKDIKTYLLNQSGVLRQEETRYFSGAIKRSLLPSELFDSGIRAIFERRNMYEKIQFLVYNLSERQFDDIIDDFFENFSMPAKITNIEPKLVRYEAAATALLTLPDNELKIAVSLGGDKSKFEEITRQAGGESSDTVNFCIPLLQEMQSRILGSLEKYGINADRTEIRGDVYSVATSSTSSAVTPEILKDIEFDDGVKLYISIAIYQSNEVIVAP